MKKTKLLLSLSAALIALTGTASLYDFLSAPRAWKPAVLWNQATGQAYRIRFQAGGKLDLAALFQDGAKHDDLKTSQDYASTLEGIVTLRKLAGDARIPECEQEPRFELRARAIDALRISNAEASDMAGLRKALEDGLEIRGGKDGSIRAFSSTVELSPLSEALLQSILSSMQLRLPRDEGGGPTVSWQALEIDGTGTYQARYDVKSSLWREWLAHETVLSRSKLSYTALSSASSGSAERLKLRAIPEGETRITLSGKCRCVLDSLESHQSVELLSGRKGLGRSEVSLSLEKLEREEAANGGDPSVDRRFNYSLSGVERRQQARMDLQARILGEATWEELAKGMGTDGIDSHLKLKADLVLHPDHASRLSAMLKGVRPEDPRYAAALRALSSAGTPEAQAALRALIEERSASLEDMRVLIPLLAQASEPTAESQAVLEKLSREASDPENRTSALLGLGTLASSLQSSDPKRAEALMAGLVGELEQAPDPSRKAAIIAALGNSGAPDLLGPVGSILADPQATPGLRGEAALALRNLDDRGSEEALLGALSASEPEELREQAARAMSYRTSSPEAVEAQRRLLANEPSPRIRLTLLGNLVRALEEEPKQRQLILETVARTDPNEEVRAEAERMAANAG